MYLAKRVSSFAVLPHPQLVAAAQKRRGPWTEGEPSLHEIWSDPIVHLVMKRDGLTVSDVMPIVEAAQARLGRGLCGLNEKMAA